MAFLPEAAIEQALLDQLRSLNYSIEREEDIGHDGHRPERESHDEVVLHKRFKNAVARLNPGLPVEAHQDAVRRVMQSEFPSLLEENRRIHKLMTEGVDVEYYADDGTLTAGTVALIDFAYPEQNDWVAVSQFVVINGQNKRRPDVVVFVNGLPLAVIELKAPGNTGAHLLGAFNQLQTYKQQIPALFNTNALLVTSDGMTARVGSLSADLERFMPWRTTDGIDIAPKGAPELSTLIEGVFEHRRLLNLLCHFTVFGKTGSGLVKIIAGYHQFHAVSKAVESTIRASTKWQGVQEDPADYGLPSVKTQTKGDKRAGVIWHTQGSGKSLLMAFYAGQLVKHPAMANPTLVVLTDRNDLDDQLFSTFSMCHDESRLAQIELDEDEKPKIDAEVDDLTENDSEADQEHFKKKWSTIEALVGSDKRLELVAQNMVTHFEDRVAALDGKAMIVCMSRHICVKLYDELIKPAGLIVDYIGIAQNLKLALQQYSKNDQKNTGIDEAQAIATMMKTYEIVRDMYYGFDYSSAMSGTPQERLVMMGGAIEWILDLQQTLAAKEKTQEGKKNAHRRYQDAVLALSQAFALASASDEARKIREEVGFFQAIRAALVKSATGSGIIARERELAIRQIVSRAVISTEIVDILAATGIKSPDISILSEDFLAEIQQMDRKNLALEALRKLLNDGIRSRSKANVVQTKAFSERLEDAVARYHANALTTAEVLQELIQLAKDIRVARQRGEESGLSDEEIAFYDALAENESAVQMMGDDKLKLIAHELLISLRKNASVDWARRDSARARMRVLVKRILRHYGYPPDLQDTAVQTVLQQAEALSAVWNT